MRCHYTFPLGESCIICTQNVEYKQSVLNESGRQLRTATQETEEQPLNVLQHDVLGLHRLTHLGHFNEEITIEQEYRATPAVNTPDLPPTDVPEPQILKVCRIQIRKDLNEYFEEPSNLDSQVEFQIINKRDGAGYTLSV